MAKFLLLGLGSAGRRHMELLASLRPAAHILTADPYAPLRPSDPALVHYSDWRTLLDHHGDADAAIIASPTEYHLVQLLACLERGIPTLVEKPLLTGAQYANGEWLALSSPEGAQTHYDLASVKCAVNCQYRYDPGIEWLIDHVSADIPKHLTFTGQDELLFRYGPHVDEVMCAHPIDTALWLLGAAAAGQPPSLPGVNLESDGIMIRGSIEHERGESHYNFRMDTGPRESWAMSAGYKTVLGHADNYRRALLAWLQWIEGGERDECTATLADGLAVSAVLAQVQHVEAISV